MAITTTKLTRAAGLAAVAAGLLFIFIQLIHPHEDVAAVTTTAWTVTHVVSLVMSVLALAGISGMYLRQVKETGLLGLVGFVLFGFTFVLTTALTFVEAVVLPPLADRAPQFVGDVLGAATGGAVVGDVGSLGTVLLVSAATYLLGGLLFGIALFRAGILARWAAVLLAAGTVATLLLPLLPHAVDRYAAFPVGLALAGLGFSLWREQRTTSQESVPSVRSPRFDPAGAE